MNRILKDKIMDNILAPVANSHSATFLEGKVIEANELKNSCTVIYKNISGTNVTQKNVQVNIYNKSIIDWFPENGDMVLLTMKGGDAFITGPSHSGNSLEVMQDLELPQDIHSSMECATMGGFIF